MSYILIFLIVSCQKNLINFFLLMGKNFMVKFLVHLSYLIVLYSFRYIRRRNTRRCNESGFLNREQFCIYMASRVKTNVHLESRLIVRQNGHGQKYIPLNRQFTIKVLKSYENYRECFIRNTAIYLQLTIRVEPYCFACFNSRSLSKTFMI